MGGMTLRNIQQYFTVRIGRKTGTKAVASKDMLCGPAERGSRTRDAAGRARISFTKTQGVHRDREGEADERAAEERSD